MDARLLIYQARLLQIACEIEGMKAENKHREICGNSIAYGDDAFHRCIGTLENLIEDIKNNT